MIIKSHVRGGYRSAAEYLKEQGQNEKTRLVEISDPAAKNLNEAFHNMWVVAANTKCTKPLHHISINPMKDERLTDAQVMAIVERCEEKYGYKMFHHQRVIVEHIKDGRQHFHVIWNRVSLYTGRPVWPGEHWKKSKQVCREMEVELGLKRPTPRRTRYKGKPRTSRKPKRKTKTGHKAGSRKNYRKKVTIKYRQTWTSKGSRQPRQPGQAFMRQWSKQTKLGPFNGSQSPMAVLAASYGLSQLPETKTSAWSARMPEVSRKSWQPETSEPKPVRPGTSTKGWPLAAVIDWETWGIRNPRRFFALWPELSR